MLVLVMQAAAEEASSAAAAASADQAVPDEGLLVYMLPYLVLGLSVMLGTQLYRGSDTGVLPCKFLGPRIAYWTFQKQEQGGSSSPAQAAATSITGSPATGNKKKVRKLQQQQQQLSAGQGGTGLLQAGFLNPELLAYLEFTEDFDYVLRYLGVTLINLAAGVAFRWYLKPGIPVHAINLLITGWAFLIYTLYKVEWAHQIIGRDEKLYMSVASVAGAITAFCLLVWVGPSVLALNMSAASEELTKRMAAVVRAKFKQLPADALQPVTEPGPMGSVLALLGGLLAGLLMAPGVRYGRVLQDFLHPPSWAAGFQPKLTDKLVAQAGFALQLLLIPLWINSMADVLRLPGNSLAVLRAMVMLLAGILQARSVPALLQAFMYHTPLHAHIVTKNPAASDELTAKSVKRVAQVTLSQASKVSLQLLLVPALLMTSALGYLLMSFASPLAADSPYANEWDKRPSVMLMSVTGFVGWWSCSMYMFWASIGTLLARVHSNVLSG